MDDVSQLLRAISGLVGVTVWPALILFLLVRFRSNFAEFFSNLGELNIKAPGLEATARRQQFEAAAALGAAIAARDAERETASDAGAAASSVADALPDLRLQRRLIGSLVLWVDDRPENNNYERRALEALGVRFVLASSTEEAMQLIRLQSFDAVISDMGRPGDSRAGYTLLDRLRASGDLTPYFIYAGSRAPEHVREAREHGALMSTESPQELVEMVTLVVAARPRR
jgi:CheY-like chemotaxis protein